MSTATDAIRFIETLQKQGVKKQVATEIVSFVDKQQGDLATKQDIKDMATKQDTREAVRPIWIVMMAGFTAITATLLTVMLYLHSDTKTEMRELKAEMKTEMKEIKELLQKR